MPTSATVKLSTAHLITLTDVSFVAGIGTGFGLRHIAGILRALHYVRIENRGILGTVERYWLRVRRLKPFSHSAESFEYHARPQ
jgi:hypothetical protein